MNVCRALVLVVSSSILIGVSGWACFKTWQMKTELHDMIADNLDPDIQHPVGGRFRQLAGLGGFVHELIITFPQMVP